MSLGTSLAISVAGTIYSATKECLVVTQNDDQGVKKPAKIASSTVFYPLSALFYPLLALVALIEAVVRTPLALIGKAVVFFIPRGDQENLEHPNTYSLATSAEYYLICGPCISVECAMKSIKKLCQQFGNNKAADTMTKAIKDFRTLCRNLVDRLVEPRINTICHKKTAADPSALTIPAESK